MEANGARVVVMTHGLCDGHLLLLALLGFNFRMVFRGSLLTEHIGVIQSPTVFKCSG